MTTETIDLTPTWVQILPALENRKVSESDVFKWTFWHCVSAALNQMVRAEVH